jgi:hypothetical protein
MAHLHGSPLARSFALTPITGRTTMKKLIPASFFQKQLNGVEPTTKMPERLELFENELR